jgi:hypothetical protein
MSIYIAKMGQLALLQKEKKSFVYNKIANYKMASDEEKKALDDNAEVIFQYYYNNRLQNINKNVKTLTTITIIYFVLNLIGIGFLLYQQLK